jgi:hypothetical protein
MTAALRNLAQEAERLNGGFSSSGLGRRTALRDFPNWLLNFTVNAS